jgi:hypothetical protein
VLRRTSTGEESEEYAQGWGDVNMTAEIRELEIRDQGSEIRDKRSEIRAYLSDLFITDLLSLIVPDLLSLLP